MTRPRFNRILLKLSGEALMGQGQFGIDPAAVDGLANEIKAAKEKGHELSLPHQRLARELQQNSIEARASHGTG